MICPMCHSDAGMVEESGLCWVCVETVKRRGCWVYDSKGIPFRCEGFFGMAVKRVIRPAKVRYNRTQYVKTRQQNKQAYREKVLQSKAAKHELALTQLRKVLQSCESSPKMSC